MKTNKEIMDAALDALAMIHEVARKKGCRYYRRWEPIAPMLGEIRFLGQNKASLGFLPLGGETAEQTLERVFGIKEEKRGMFEEAFRQSVSGDGNERKNMLTLRSSALCCLLHLYDKAGSLSFDIPHEVGYCPFTVKSVKFEDKNPVFGWGKSSNMDALLEGNDGEEKRVSLYLESKMTEYLVHQLENKEYISPAYEEYLRKWLKGIPGLEISLEEREGKKEVRLRSDRPCYIDGLKQMCHHLISMMKKAHSDDEIRHLGEIALPFKGKELDRFREDYRIMARNMNASFEETKVHVLPDLLFYGEEIEAIEPKARIFYGEGPMPQVGAFYYIDGRLHRKQEPFVPEEGNPFVNGRVGHLELYRTIQMEGLMDALEHDDYSYWPRGRVIYDLSEGISLVYMDPCLLADPSAKDAVREEFRLGEDAVFLEDEHYRCHGCDEEIAFQDEGEN